ncbi:vWA domain-containing protein [Micromonospora sp. NPDC004704]
MSETSGRVLPVYLVADESRSMSPVVDELNAGLTSLHDALLREPMAAAKVRFSVLGFSNDVIVHVALADLRAEGPLPQLSVRDGTSYGAAFSVLLDRIPADVRALKREGFSVHRPAVFFLSDGQPTDPGQWEEPYRTLVDRERTPTAPNIIACGIGDARAATILRVATRPEFAFVATPGVEVGLAIAEFCAALTKSVIKSGQALGGADAELVVERPDNFRMALDVV